MDRTINREIQKTYNAIITLSKSVIAFLPSVWYYRAMALLNYTTKIEAEQTIGEIQKMLSKHGVTAMMTEYDGPHVSAVSFQMKPNGKVMAYKLPCNWRSVLQVFKDQNISMKHPGGREVQAIRTAWRVIKDWIEAQLALVEINMATIPQIFLPYTMMKDGRTLSEHIESNPGMLLGDGK